MIAHYLKASDEAALWTSLEAASLASKQYSEFDEDGNGVGEFAWAKADGYDLDVIGEIYKPTGETDAEGSPVMEKLDGYHANIRKWDDDFSEGQLAALPTIAQPTNPVRVWAD